MNVLNGSKSYKSALMSVAHRNNFCATNATVFTLFTNFECLSKFRNRVIFEASCTNHTDEQRIVYSKFFHTHGPTAMSKYVLHRIQYYLIFAACDDMRSSLRVSGYGPRGCRRGAALSLKFAEHQHRLAP